jgi:hypothetical protein
MDHFFTKQGVAMKPGLASNSQSSLPLSHKGWDYSHVPSFLVFYIDHNSGKQNVVIFIRQMEI